MDSEFSIKLRLEKSSKSHLFLIFAFAVGLFFLSVLVAVFVAPEIIKKHDVTISKCSEAVNDHCYSDKDTHEVWEGRIPTATPHSAKDLSFNMTMEVLVLSKQEIVSEANKSTVISCISGTCNTVVIFYLPYLKYDEYYVVIKHKSRILSDSVEIELSYIDSSFTKYQLATKYVFFALSTIFFVNFLIYSLKVPSAIRSFESKLLLPLAVSLVFFNEPLLWATIAFMSPFWSAVSVFCNTQFLAMLLLFWLVDLQHYRQSAHSSALLLVGSLLVAALFGLVFAGYLYAHERLRYNPSYDWNHDLNHTYKEVFIGIICIAAALAVWIGLLSLRAVTGIKKLGARERSIKMINVMAICFAFVGIGIGAFQPIPANSRLMLIFEAGFNIYVMLLQVLYSPTKSSLLEYHFDKNIEYNLIKSHESESAIELP
jgi:hypothetical protein